MTMSVYSSTESANVDAQKMGSIINSLVAPARPAGGTEDGVIDMADNEFFIKQFVDEIVPENERSTVIDKNGNLSKSGKERIESAVFAYAYEDDNLQFFAFHYVCLLFHSVIISLGRYFHKLITWE